MVTGGEIGCTPCGCTAASTASTSSTLNAMCAKPASHGRAFTRPFSAGALYSISSIEWPGARTNAISRSAPGTPVIRSVSRGSRGAFEVTSKPRPSRNRPSARSRSETVKLVWLVPVILNAMSGLQGFRFGHGVERRPVGPGAAREADAVERADGELAVGDSQAHRPVRTLVEIRVRRKERRLLVLGQPVHAVHVVMAVPLDV